jgi:hypothetical protein
VISAQTRCFANHGARAYHRIPYMDELFCSMLCVSSSLLSRFQHVCPMTGPGIQDARVGSCPSATANRTRDGRFMELWASGLCRHIIGRLKNSTTWWNLHLLLRCPLSRHIILHSTLIPHRRKMICDRDQSASSRAQSSRGSSQHRDRKEEAAQMTVWLYIVTPGL